MKKSKRWFIATLSVLAGLLAFSLIPNTSWNLSVFAQTYTGGGGGGGTVDDSAPDVAGLDVGTSVRAIAFGPGTITDEMAYRLPDPKTATLLRGDAEVQLFAMAPTSEVYPAPQDVNTPEPVKTRMVDEVSIEHYFISIVEGVYLYQVNIYDGDGDLFNDQLMYLVYPDGDVYWFYQNR